MKSFLVESTKLTFVIKQHVVADFCINPSQSIQTLIAGTNANIEAIVAYYTTCTGDTPFDSDYKTALSEFTQFNTTFYTYYNETISYLVSHGESTDCVVSFKTNVSLYIDYYL